MSTRRRKGITCPPDTPTDVAAEFKRIRDLLGDRAEPIDALPVLMLAQSWVTWKKAAAEVNRLGNVVMSGGTAVANPHLAIAHRAYGQVVKLLRELKLT